MYRRPIFKVGGAGSSIVRAKSSGTSQCAIAPGDCSVPVSSDISRIDRFRVPSLTGDGDCRAGEYPKVVVHL